MGYGIRLNVKGFDDLLRKIEKANGKAEIAAEKCLKESAEILQDELKAAMRTAGGGVETDLINRMPNYTIENSGTRITARVGYKPTSYNPNNLSDYFKAMFAQYGTPHRKSHGHERARGFIAVAKKAAKPKIKKQQEKTLNDILEDLKK